MSTAFVLTEVHASQLAIQPNYNVKHPGPGSSWKQKKRAKAMRLQTQTLVTIITRRPDLHLSCISIKPLVNCANTKTRANS
jgi:hypothetical protein